MTHYIPIKLNKQYEISSTYPYIIRHKQTHEDVKFEIDSAGYRICQLTHGTVNPTIKTWRLIYIVAYQWLPNPNNYNFVDVINPNDKLNENVNNLIWQPINTITTENNYIHPMPCKKIKTNLTPLPYSEQKINTNGNITEIIHELPSNVINITHFHDEELLPDTYFYDPTYKRVIMKYKNEYKGMRAHNVRLKTNNDKKIIPVKLSSIQP